MRVSAAIEVQQLQRHLFNESHARHAIHVIRHPFVFQNDSHSTQVELTSLKHCYSGMLP